MRRVLMAVGLGTWIAASLAGCSRQGEGERCDTRNSSSLGAPGGDCEDNLVCTSSGVCCPTDKPACGVTEKPDTGAPEVASDTGAGDTGAGDTGPGDTIKSDTPSETPADAPTDAPGDAADSVPTDAADAG